MRYVYSVVRFVPDPARGEFINVGAIVGSDDAGEWDLRQVENMTRARHLDDRSALPGAMQFLNEIGKQVDTFWDDTVEELDDAVPTPLSESWLANLAAGMRNIVQLSAPIPITAVDLDEAMALVFDELVVDPLSAGLDYRRRTRAQFALRNAYVDARLKKGTTFFEKVPLRAEGVSERLDFVVANGKPVQLAQAWSFELPKQPELARRIRAWGWTISKLRKNGGSLAIDGRPSIEIPADIDLEVVYVPPAQELEKESAFTEAQIVFNDVGATFVPIDEAKQVGERAADLLAG
jgi:hypothetical protein